MDFDRFPAELRALPNFVVWKYVPRDDGKFTKLPYNPRTGGIASTDDPDTWATYSEAVAVAGAHADRVAGIGFVLTQDAGYCFIDLDNVAETQDPAGLLAWHKQIEAYFGSYSELSPSGSGLHIICRGHVPQGKNNRQRKVEIYSQLRYMTVTGNVFRDAPVRECQPQIDWLFDQLGGVGERMTFDDRQAMLFKPEIETDEQVLKHAFEAANGAKFQALWENRLEDAGFIPADKRRSEADFALVDMLQFFTQSSQQIRRLFLASGLNNREKASRPGYVEAMIEKSFDRTPRGIDIAGTMAALDEQRNREALERERAAEAARAAAAPPSFKPAPTVGVNLPPPVDQRDNPYLRPLPGLLGEIAYFIYQSAPRPVAEIAVAGALGLMSGICGRAYNINGTGLNTYVLLLAKTGRGKEAIKSGIDRLMEGITRIDGTGGGVPGAKEFIGPQEIASGQALLKYLSKTSRSFVSIISEFDAFMASLTATNVSQSIAKLRQVVLYCYARSGRGAKLEQSIYSETDKNVPVIPAPAVALIGEGTPERFYELLNEDLISDGFLSRFSIIEYDGPRTPPNKTFNAMKPSEGLVRALSALSAIALSLNAKDEVTEVQMSQEALRAFDAFNDECDAEINRTGAVVSQLWNRAHLKALKFASLMAVGVNWHAPVIDLYQARMAIDCAKFETMRLADRFEKGAFGAVSVDRAQNEDIRRKLQSLFAGKSNGEKYKLSPEALQLGMFNRFYLQGATSSLKSFKEARNGAALALTGVLQSLIQMGVIDEVNRADKDRLHILGQAYIVRDWGWLNAPFSA